MINKDKIINIKNSILVGLFLLLFPFVSRVIITVTNMDDSYGRFLQAGFFVIPILIVVILLILKKLDKEKLMLVFNRRLKDYLYYIPVITIFIPVLIKGFQWNGLSHFFGNLLLYLFVGISEELYFRGIIPALLEREFNRDWVIIISSLIFGIAHVTSAFVDPDPLIVIITILNALIFGFMAVCLRYKTKTIIPLMLIHFLFDFETKFIILDGVGLNIAFGIRGALMFIYTIIIYILLKKEDENEQSNQQVQKQI